MSTDTEGTTTSGYSAPDWSTVTVYNDDRAPVTVDGMFTLRVVDGLEIELIPRCALAKHLASTWMSARAEVSCVYQSPGPDRAMLEKGAAMTKVHIKFRPRPMLAPGFYDPTFNGSMLTADEHYALKAALDEMRHPKPSPKLKRRKK